MKVCHVLHGFPPELTGGTERTVEALATAMKKLGHEVVIVAGSLERAATSRVDEGSHAGLRVLRMHRDDLWFESWDKAWSPGVSARFLRLLEVEKPDVVHVHHWIRLSSDLVRIAAATGCITAVTLHDYFGACASPVRRVGDDEPAPPETPRWINRSEAREAFELHRRDFTDEIRTAHLRFAPSHAHALGVQQMFGAPLGAILPSPPPLLHVPPRRPRRDGARGRKLVTWGSLYPDKGIDLVLDALFAIGGGWSLEVFGEAHEPEYRDRLRERSKGIPVTWRGRFDVADLAASDADYAVFPSMCHESYGLTLDEAQCLGLPIIAADLPAYREHAPERSCRFFAPADPGALAMALLDEAALQALEVPPQPAIVTPRVAAERLLQCYADARVGAHRAFAADRLVTDRERAAFLFRRAERRLWTALQQRDPPAPPD